MKGRSCPEVKVWFLQEPMIYEIRNNELTSSNEISLQFENVFFDKNYEKRQTLRPEFFHKWAIGKKIFDSYKTHKISKSILQKILKK